MADSLLASLLGTVGQYYSAQMYGMFYPVADAPFAHSRYSNFIFQNNGYIRNKTYFRDSDIQRRMEALKRKAVKYNVSEEMIDAFSPLIEMLMKYDSPKIREYLREKCPFGNLLLYIYDSVTENEIGIEELYSSMADPYGTERGNDAAAYAANYAAGLIRDQEVTSDGMRPIDAGALSSWINYKKTRGYDFAIATGADTVGAPTYSEAYAKAWNESADKSGVEAIATKAYLRNLRDSTDDKVDKAILDELYKRGNVNIEWSDIKNIAGAKEKYATKDDIGHLKFLDKYKLSSDKLSEDARTYASKGVAGMIREAVRQDIAANTGYWEEFKRFAEDKKYNINDSATKIKAIEEFTTEVLNNYNNPDSDLYLGDDTKLSTRSKVQDILDINKAARNNMGERGNRIEAEIRKLEEETRLAEAVGRTFWSTLSPEMQRKYMDATKASGATAIGEAQATLGREMMNKFAHGAFRKGNYGRAAAESIHYRTAMDMAGISSDESTQLFSLLGSTMQNQSLVSMAATGAADFMLAAKYANVRLSEEQRAMVTQNYGRLSDSDKMRNLMLLASMGDDELNPNSTLGKFRSALLSGELTPEQKKLMDMYTSGEKDLIADLADETHITQGGLLSRAQWIQTNSESVTTEGRAYLVNELTNSSRRNYNNTIVTSEAVEAAYDVIGKAALKNLRSGVNEKTFSEIVVNMQKSGVIAPESAMRGEATDEQIVQLKEQGYKKEAAYAEKRRAAREEARKKLLKEHPDWNEEGEEFKVALDRQTNSKSAETLMNTVRQKDNSIEDAQLATVDPTKGTKKTKEGVKENLVGETPASPAGLTPAQAIGFEAGKDLSGGAKIWEQLLNALGVSGGGENGDNGGGLGSILSSILDASGAFFTGISKAVETGVRNGMSNETKPTESGTAEVPAE